MALQRIERIALGLAFTAAVLTSCGTRAGSPATTGTVERDVMSRLRSIDEFFYPASPSAVEDCRGKPC